MRADYSRSRYVLALTRERTYTSSLYGDSRFRFRENVCIKIHKILYVYAYSIFRFLRFVSGYWDQREERRGSLFVWSVLSRCEHSKLVYGWCARKDERGIFLCTLRIRGSDYFQVRPDSCLRYSATLYYTQYLIVKALGISTNSWPIRLADIDNSIFRG